MKKRKVYLLIVLLIIFAIFGVFYMQYVLRTRGVDYYKDFGSFGKTGFRISTWPSGPSPDPVWTENNVSFDKGKLILKIDKNDDGLTTGEVFTQKSFGYGLYQVRMMPIKNSGVVSAFFNYAKEGDIGTEIDIEFLGYDTTKVQFNYHTNGVGGHEYMYDLGFDASKDYHKYGFNWTEDAIYWYVDDVLAYEVHADDIPELEAPMVMDVWTGGKEDWLKKYDGKTPLYAYYDWISYTSPTY